MQSATTLFDRNGNKTQFAPSGEDPAGLYVLYAYQGSTHGSERLTDKSVVLPYVHGSEEISDVALTALLLRHYRRGNADAVCVEASAIIRNKLLKAFAFDLREIGGCFPAGKPNSVSTGLQRSNGMPYGNFACTIRAHEQLRRCWKLLAVALGRSDPFAQEQFSSHGSVSQPAVATSFDAVLYTRQ